MINGKVTVNLSENTPVSISIYDVSGRLLYINRQRYGSGTHAIQALLQSAGIYLYKVSIGKKTYSFKSSPFGTVSTKRDAVLSCTSTLAKQAKAKAVIADVISVIEEGFINYRDSMKTSDTSGVVVKMIPNEGNVTDIDGNVYQSVRIGNQVWTVECLKTTKYNDGTAIPHVSDSTQWAGLTTSAYCYYENNAANKDNFGALYNWYAVNTGKLAPEGWKIPTNAEWNILLNYLIANGYNWDGTTSGNKVAKAMASKTDWRTYPYPCTESSCPKGLIGFDLYNNNSSGFSALPGGIRDAGGYNSQSSGGACWTATALNAGHAWSRSIGYSFEFIAEYDGDKQDGLSVRLLRN